MIFTSLSQVLKHQRAAGAEGITTVLGPPTHSFPPLYRQTGVMARYLKYGIRNLNSEIWNLKSDIWNQRSEI